MAKDKHLKRKAAKAQRKQAAQTSNSTKSFWAAHQMPLIALFVIGFALYGYTLTFGEHVLDDKIAISSNEFTVQGFAGIGDLFANESMVGFFGRQKDLLAGGRYRPFSMVTFAAEIGLFGKDAFFISHLINILLYCLTGFLLYRILTQLFKNKQSNNKGSSHWYLTLPFIATALFLVHPLHTEVVANLKGRDEILTLLGALTSLYLSLKYLGKNNIVYLILSGIAFLIALLSKENALTFLAVIPLTLYFFTNATLKQYIHTLAPIVAATFVFFVIRYQVLGFVVSSGTEAAELLNNPFLNSSNSDKFATIFYTLGLYLKLLVFPHPLTHDYYPFHIPIVSWGSIKALLPLVLYLALGIYAVLGIRKKNVVAYGILFFLITLSIVSNLVFPVGTFMNERFMYIPSVGFCLIVAYLLAEKMPLFLKNVAAKQAITGAFALIFLLFAARSLVRIPAWKSNEALFLIDVKTSTNSTKANTSAGGILFETGVVLPKDSPQRKKRLGEAKTYLEKALKIYPDNPNALLLLGSTLIESGVDYDKALLPYHRLLEVNPDNDRIHRNLSYLSETVEEQDKARKLIQFYEQKVLPLGVNSDKAYDALGVLWGKKMNNLEKSIGYFEKSLAINPDNRGSMHDLAIAYGMQGNFEKSIELSQKAIKMDPDNKLSNAKSYLNIAISHQKLGREDEAKTYFEQAFALDPSLRR